MSIKSIFSFAGIYSYARQLCTNASKLKALHIPTVTVLKLFHSVDNISEVLLARKVISQTQKMTPIEVLDRIYQRPTKR